MNLVIVYNSFISLLFSFYYRLLEIKLTTEELKHVNVIIEFLYSLSYELMEKFKHYYIEIILCFIVCYFILSLLIVFLIYSFCFTYLKGIHNTLQRDENMIIQSWFDMHCYIVCFLGKWLFYSIIPCAILFILVTKK